MEFKCYCNGTSFSSWPIHYYSYPVLSGFNGVPFSNGDPMTLANHEPVPIYCGVDNGVGGFNRFFERTGVLIS